LFLELSSPYRRSSLYMSYTFSLMRAVILSSIVAYSNVTIALLWVYIGVCLFSYLFGFLEPQSLFLPSI